MIAHENADAAFAARAPDLARLAEDARCREAGEAWRALRKEQEAIALNAFRGGEILTFDLFRVRQLRLEAANDEGRAAVEVNRARSRLNQALGAIP